jgi:ELWxxDGT repeat protein
MATQSITFFDKPSPTTGDELWATDGSNTWLVKDINPGVGGSNPIDQTQLNGNLLFFGYDSTNGYQLWTSDGTAGGTVSLSNIGAVDPQYFASLNDGSAFASNVASLPTAGGNAFFINYATNAGWQLWETNGTAAGTTALLTINQPATTKTFFDLTPVSEPDGTNKLFFETFDNANAAPYELWVTDGSVAGTQELASFASPFSGGVDYPFPYDVGAGQPGLPPPDNFVFSAADGLWKSDGTIPGTVQFTGTVGSSLTVVNALNKELFFVSGNELWMTEGTQGTTAQIATINNPHNLTDYGGDLLFFGDDGLHGNQLWKWDPFTGGTVSVTDINPAGGGFVETPGAPVPAVVGSEMFFVASDGFDGQQLWKTDGTAAGTVMVTDINPGSGGFNPTNLTDANGVLYFDANDGNGNALWKSDGTAAGTVKVADSVDPHPMAVVDVPIVSPTVSVSGASSTLHAGQTDLITFTFNEAVTGFDHADVNVSGGTLGTISQTDATHYTAIFTPTAGVNTQTATIQVAASGSGASLWADSAGHAGTASNTFSITEDTKLPTVGVAGASSSLQAGQTDVITFSFSEAVTGFDRADVNVSDGTLGAISQTDTTHYTAIFTAGATPQTATIQVAASGVGTSSWTDLAGNAGTASNTFAITEGSNPYGFARSVSTFGLAVSSDPPAVTPAAQSLAVVMSQSDSFNFGHMNDTLGFASNQITIDSLNALHNVVQQSQADLANLQQSAAEATITHDALGLVMPDVHAANVHASAFHLA